MFAIQNLKKYSIFEIGAKINTEERAFVFLQEIGILPIHQFCDKCTKEGTLIKNKKNFMYQCGLCGVMWSPFKNKLFYKSKLKISSIVKMIYCFSIRMTVSKTVKQTSISKKS